MSDDDREWHPYTFAFVIGERAYEYDQSSPTAIMGWYMD